MYSVMFILCSVLIETDLNVVNVIFGFPVSVSCMHF